ncbi:MAG TPA: hypothetical protein VK435_00885 [Thermodesulfovibrionales bacterium]|nr:hypothetical protein [Thermodesulfovibrionales bacterium]
MKRRFFPGALAIVTLLMIFSSCSAPTLTSEWDDTAYEGGPLKKILVMGVDASTRTRRTLEERFAVGLRERGAEVIPGYTIFPEDEMPQRETVLRKVAELGVDSVLVVTTVSVRDIGTYETYPSLIGNGYYEYYVQCCNAAVSEGYSLKIQAKVFDARSDKPIWSASSEEAFRYSIEPAIDSFVSLVVGDLHKRKLLR